MKSIEGISEMQEERRKFDPITAAKIDEFIAKITSYMNGECIPFTFEVIDPSGNSFIQNPDAPKIDPNLKMVKFLRTVEHYTLMGYNAEEAEATIME